MDCLVQLHELVGAGAGTGGILADVAARSLQASGADDRGGQAHRQVLLERGVGGAQRDLDGVIVDSLEGGDAGACGLLAEHEGRVRHVGGAVGLELALDGGDHGGGVEVGAVMELHALAQLDGVLQSIIADLGQFGGQARNDRGVGVAEAVQAIEDVGSDLGGLAVIEERRVKGARVSALSVGDGVGDTCASISATALATGLLAAAAAGHAYQAKACCGSTQQTEETAPAKRILLFHRMISFPPPLFVGH